jgi:RimJ/RimL family protein N-acetyltransferase
MVWGFCYFGGEYNEQFISDCLNHEIIEPRMYFIFSDIETLEKIDKKMLDKWEHSFTAGAYHYHKLNAEKFNNHCFKDLPENYEIVLNKDKNSEKAVLFYDGVEAGHCTGVYNEKVNEINLDVFLEDEHRNKGIGPVLCAELINYHLSQNHDDITWGCFGINVPSLKCALKLGFEEICTGDVIFIFA